MFLGHVCEMEGFNGPKELNSTEPTGVVMLEIEHNKEPIASGTRENGKKTHARGFNVVENAK